MACCKHPCGKTDGSAELIGGPLAVGSLVAYAPAGIVSRALMDGPAGSVTVFAFDAGQRLSEHQAPYDALVQVIEGAAELTIGGVEHGVSAGQVMIMPANVPHAVNAPERFKMMLTMIKS